MDELEFDAMIEDMALAVNHIAQMRGITTIPNLRVISALQPIFEALTSPFDAKSFVDDQHQHPDV